MFRLCPLARPRLLAQHRLGSFMRARSFTGRGCSLIFGKIPVLVMLLGYLLGAIPFGIILTRLTGAGDLRSIGSGSIGATNVLRTGRKGLAAATVILDGAKGALGVLIGERLLPGGGGALSGGAVAGTMALIGHCYPIWLRFRGGKGVATMLGVCLALAWPVGLVFALVWLAAFGLSRISSIGGIAAAISAPIAALLLGRWALVPALAVMLAAVLWRHRGNIARIVRGKEPRVGGRSKA